MDLPARWIRVALGLTMNLALIGALIGVLIWVGVTPIHLFRSASAGRVAVGVLGDRLVDGRGRTLVLHGVDRSGMEYACVQGFGLADGPMDQASVDVMKTWHVNAVRLPLNEDCWLGINGVKEAFSGAEYRLAVADYVSELHRDGMIAILDLHWNAPGATPATSQEDMADADHAPAFWSSVARLYRADPGVIFDLYNEPHDITWSCWDRGCATPGFETAGMQTLVDVVRATGATQPVMLAPIGWAGATGGPDQYGTDVQAGWLRWRPVDPARQEILSVHLYNYSGCRTVSCWNRTVSPEAGTVPVVVGEFGEVDCGTAFDTSLMDWSDAHRISYLAWSWHQSVDACGADGPTLIRSYDGVPTTTGAAVKAHYQVSVP